MEKQPLESTARVSQAQQRWQMALLHCIVLCSLSEGGKKRLEYQLPAKKVFKLTVSVVVIVISSRICTSNLPHQV